MLHHLGITGEGLPAVAVRVQATKLSISRDRVRELRAILHNCAKHGLASQNRDGHEHFAEYLQGCVAYVEMVDPTKGAQLRRALDKALKGPS